MGLRCVIVDDSPPFLKAARLLLEREGIGVVGSAATNNDAVRMVDELRPDVVLVDINLGADSGFDLVQQLATGPLASVAGATPALILISSHSRDDFEELIAESPATGFLGKSSLSADAVRALICKNGG